MMDGPMITMDLHQQILAAARNDALDEAAFEASLQAHEENKYSPLMAHVTGAIMALKDKP
jgi:hypothetical protein